MSQETPSSENPEQSRIEELERENAELRERIEALERENELLRQENAAAENRNAQLVELANKDHLTGLLNRQGFKAALENHIRATNRPGVPAEKQHFCFALVDMDYFKSINDTFGHDAGDVVLKVFARQLDKAVHRGDIVYRYGGEEFGILFIETNEQGATNAARRICDEIKAELKDACLEELKVKGEVFGGIIEAFERREPITVSIGVTQYVKDENPDTLKNRADKALYRAKRTGRNKVVPASELERKSEVPQE